MKKIIAVLLIASILMLNISLVQAALKDAVAISISLVNQDPDPASAGNTVELRLAVANMGGRASDNLMVEIVPDYPFELLSGQSAVQNIGSMQGYQGYYGDNTTKIVKFNIKINKDATAGSYELKVRYYEEGKAWTEKSLSVDVSSSESAEVIYINRTVLVPGKEDVVEFTINNVGSAPLRELTFSWENADDTILPVGSDNTRYIKYIDVGDSAKLQYRVIADTNADAGLYKLDLQLTYTDPVTGTEKEINTIAGVYVGGGTDFDIAFSESSSGQTSFTIANIGSNPASSVSVIVPQQQGWTVSGTNSMIIGNLNTGDYTVASFALQQSAQTMPEAAAGNQQRNITDARRAQTWNASMQTQNTLKLQIAYTDTMGNRAVVEKEVAINQQASTTGTTTSTNAAGMPSFGRNRQQSFFSKYKWYIAAFAVLLVLVIGGIAYRRYSKEKLLNPNFKIKDLFKTNSKMKRK